MIDPIAPHGLGLGLRPVHYQDLLATSPAAPVVDFLEVLSENYLHTGGRPLRMLDRIAERFPLVLHGVAMNVAGTDPIDRSYLRELLALQRRCGALHISDHLCWTAVDGVQLHDLLPIPYSEAVLAHTAARVRRIQDQLEQPLVLENPSTYVQFAGADLDEAGFLAELVAHTGCRLLIDVNNVFVSACNHGFDPRQYLRKIPWHAVAWLHLAGHTVLPTHRLDTHDQPVAAEVWQLHAYAQQLSSGLPTVLERDDAIPPLADCLAELERARLPLRRRRGVAS
ncbi:MAG: DUF692 domain-containing protein [Planctomycetes bacterium]|jgi:hypothetical protein|nr:DUF692 domain-containing protein [Planctomycetota bacterium]